MKSIIYSVIGLAVVITAGFLIKVPATNVASGSWADNYVRSHPAPEGQTISQVKVPLIIKLLSKKAV